MTTSPPTKTDILLEAGNRASSVKLAGSWYPAIRNSKGGLVWMWNGSECAYASRKGAQAKAQTELSRIQREAGVGKLGIDEMVEVISSAASHPTTHLEAHKVLVEFYHYGEGDLERWEATRHSTRQAAIRSYLSAIPADDYLATTLGDDEEAKAAAIAYCQEIGIDTSEFYMNADGKVIPPVIKSWSRIRIGDKHVLEVSHIAANLGSRKGQILTCRISIITADGTTSADIVDDGWIEPADWLKRHLPPGSCDDSQATYGWLKVHVPSHWGIMPVGSEELAA